MMQTDRGYIVEVFEVWVYSSILKVIFVGRFPLQNPQPQIYTQHTRYPPKPTRIFGIYSVCSGFLGYIWVDVMGIGGSMGGSI